MDIGLDWESIEKPLKWKKIFENNNPIDCEVGYGNGCFLIHKGKEYPERNFFGIDYSLKSYKKTLKKIKKEELKNVRLICMEAKACFIVLLPENSVNHLYVNFPDPWPKSKHEKNRLLDREFLTIAATRVINGGEIIIVTDDDFYRDFILEEIEAIHYWKSLFHKGYTDELSGYYQTKYEKKWRDEGRKIFYMIFQKKREPDVEFSMKRYSFDDFELSNIDISDIEKLKDVAIKDNESVAKLLGLNQKGKTVTLHILLKDETLVRNKTVNLDKKNNKSLKVNIPHNLFCSHSFKIFIDRLKTLDKE